LAKRSNDAEKQGSHVQLGAGIAHLFIATYKSLQEATSPRGELNIVAFSGESICKQDMEQRMVPLTVEFFFINNI